MKASGTQLIENIRHCLWLGKLPESTQERRSRLVFHFTLLVFILVLLFVSALLLAAPRIMSNLTNAGVLLVSLPIAAFYLRRNKLRIGGILLAVVMWVSSLYASMYAGVFSYGFSSFFFVIVLVGFIYGLRGMAGTLTITILMEGGLAYAQISGLWTPAQIPSTDPVSVAIIQVFLLSINVFVGGLVIYYYQLEHRLAASELEERKRVQKDLENRQKDLLKNEESLELARQASRDSEAVYRSIFEQSPSEISLSQITGEILEVNDKFCQVMGMPRSEILGRTTQELGRMTSEQISSLRVIAAQNGGVVEQQEITTYVNGVERTVLLSGRVLVLKNRPVALSVLTDISDRKRAEEKVLHHLKEINSLRQIDTSIILGADLQDTLRIILKQAVDSLHVDEACLFLWNEAQGSVQQVISTGDLDCEGYSMNYLEFPAWQALQQGRSVKLVGEELQAEYFSRRGIQTCCAAPMIQKGEARGALQVCLQRRIDPEPEWMDYLETLAGQAVIAIANSDLLESLRKKNEELLEAYESTIAGWARALEIRDNETFGHSERVLALAVNVADALNMPESEKASFKRGVLLHDIGKIGVPDSILFKPGPLDQEEWKIMRQHPVFAQRLLQGISFLQGSLDVPYCHHERWDGSGYPQGLAGEDIPLSARIFAVVDVWDALTSDRPYRKAWSEQQTRDYLLENAGIQFDPQVVNVFLETISQINNHP